jgi:hypothetical protein
MEPKYSKFLRLHVVTLGTGMGSDAERAARCCLPGLQRRSLCHVYVLAVFC